MTVEGQEMMERRKGKSGAGGGVFDLMAERGSDMVAERQTC